MRLCLELRPHREVKLRLELRIPRTIIIIAAERILLDSDPDPITFLNESESMLIFREASAKDFLVRRAERAERVTRRAPATRRAPPWQWPAAGVGRETSRGHACQVKSVQVTSGQDMGNQDRSGQVMTGHVT